ncbi:MAG: hypothetical protein HY718_10930 [Planctomycetes bacterium]|nr:hypothetical protein [Planctomycetota bacterium]
MGVWRPTRAAVAIAIGFAMSGRFVFAEASRLVPDPARAASTRPAGGVQDPLAARQQIVRDRLAQLEDRMFRLSEKLAQPDPQQAKRLERALRESGELLIRHHMEQAIQLLEQGSLVEAADHQAAAHKALEDILKLLTETGEDSRQRQEEIDRMEALRQQVGRLLEQQYELRAKTDPAERLSERLAAAAVRLQVLIDRQSRQIEDTKAMAGGSADQAARRQSDALGRSQAAIRKDAESLMRELGQPEAAATQPAEAPLAHIAAQAREQMQDAADHMQSAEQELGEARPASSVPEQAKALESLQKALESLREQQGSVEPVAPAEAARQQRELQQQAGKLADSMQGRQEGKEQGADQHGDKQQGGDQQGRQQRGNQQGDQQGSEQGSEQSRSGEPPPPPMPGTNNMRRAQQHMRNAGDKLDKEKPADATQDQDQAIQELEQARTELQDSLDQLRREQQEEMLAGLEQRFRGMLLEQKAINTATASLDERKARWTRSDSLNLAALAEKERRLSGEAAKALNVLTEDGTTVVFPEMVTQVRDDMADVARRLGEKRTGEITRQIQAEIVQALEELIQAIEQRRKDGPPPPSMAGGGGGGGESDNATPLLPGSAELKLLRSSQVRVNRQTQDLDAAATRPSADVGDQARRLATRQEQLAGMARKINERAEGH